MSDLNVNKADDTINGNAIEDVEKDDMEVIANWEELPGVKSELLRGIYSYGFENPSPIQQRGIVPLFNKKDIIAQAQSGTGKTGCFTIGTLQLIDTSVNTTQAIVISPTRELSIQTKKVFDSIGAMMKGLTTHLLIGGTSTDTDIQALSSHNPHVLIGCPGRIHDMMRRRKLNLRMCRIIVVDEADEMLSQGFKEQIYDIFQYLPSEVQVALFSATLPVEINGLTEKFMRNPVKILVKTEQLTLEGINQFYVALNNDDEKYEALKDIYGAISVSQCIIYCNSIHRVQNLYAAMTSDDFSVCQIHSNIDKTERSRNYNEFITGKTRVLISTNLTARGIDVQQVSSVINFDVPKSVDTYLHRIGRSGRWGRKGMAINFVTKFDVSNIRAIEQHYATEIKELPANIVA
jgi:translation initiation factor 4A